MITMTTTIIIFIITIITIIIAKFCLEAFLILRKFYQFIQIILLKTRDALVITLH